MMANSENDTNVLALTTEIVSAYLSHNNLAAGAIPDLMIEVHKVLSQIDAPASDTQPAEPQTPAVPVKKSIRPTAIICLEDGQPLKVLKRHLAAHHGMTPDEYRQKWNLPADYPMVAPNYSAQRASLAKQLGLGRKPAAQPARKSRIRKPAKDAT